MRELVHPVVVLAEEIFLPSPRPSVFHVASDYAHCGTGYMSTLVYLCSKYACREGGSRDCNADGNFRIMNTRTGCQKMDSVSKAEPMISPVVAKLRFTRPCSFNTSAMAKRT